MSIDEDIADIQESSLYLTWHNKMDSFYPIPSIVNVYDIAIIVNHLNYMAMFWNHGVFKIYHSQVEVSLQGHIMNVFEDDQYERFYASRYKIRKTYEQLYNFIHRDREPE